MLSYAADAQTIVPEAPLAAGGCRQCAQQRDDLLALATAYYSTRPHPSGLTAEQIRDEIREGRPRRYCEGCGKRIPPYHAMQNAGFQAHTVHHFHAQPVDGDQRQRSFNLPVHTELCHECYLADFQQVYPDHPLPQIANVRFD